MLEYALATFPIADSEIEYAIASFTTVTACASGTGTLCGYNTIWKTELFPHPVMKIGDSSCKELHALPVRKDTMWQSELDAVEVVAQEAATLHSS